MKFWALGLLFLAGPVFGSPSKAASECFQKELNLWEQVRGRLPDPDEADLIIDLCVRRAYEDEKDQDKQQEKEQKKE